MWPPVSGHATLFLFTVSRLEMPVRETGDNSSNSFCARTSGFNLLILNFINPVRFHPETENDRDELSAISHQRSVKTL